MTQANKSDFRLADLFRIQPGDFHATKELEPGDTPLISCGDERNGLVGYYTIPADKKHKKRVTLAFNGSWPLMAKFHPYEFGAKDDVAVLIPIEPISDGALLYVAAILDRMVWRYHYGRKCYQEKMTDVIINLPIAKKNGGTTLDEKLMDRLMKKAIEKVSNSVSLSIGRLVAPS